MLSGKHITFPELPRGSSFFDTKKHLRRGAHAYRFVSLTSEISCHEGADKMKKRKEKMIFRYIAIPSRQNVYIGEKSNQAPAEE